MLLLKNADVYAPEPLGTKDLLVEGHRIVKIADRIEAGEAEQAGMAGVLEVFDVGGRKLVPGFVDQHVHITGGGGEDGPSSRVPGAQVSAFIRYGVTTVLGVMGTDGVTKSVEDLYAKAKAFNAEGLSCYMLTGSYAYPAVTATGSVERDLYLLDVCIGVKIAVSDHRGSNVTAEELIRLASESRRGGLISGKAGMVTMHLGAGKARLGPVLQALEDSDLPVKIFVPTHVNMRSPELLDDCVKFAAMGGTMDFTGGLSDEDNKVEAGKIRDLLDRGVDARFITVSSDAFGSQPRFDDEGNTIGITYSTSQSLPALFKALVAGGLPVETALGFFTTNPARVMGLEGCKGVIAEGADADFVSLADDLTITDVIARGRVAMRDTTIVLKGRYED